MLEFLSIGYLTGAFCLNFPPLSEERYRPACHKAAEAIVIQRGWDKDLEAIRRRISRSAEQKVREYVNPTPEMVVVGTIVYTAAIKREVSLTTRVRPVADSLALHATPDSVSARLTWQF
jgi:hypothetical protein